MKYLSLITIFLTLVSCYDQDSYSLEKRSTLTVIDAIVYSKESLVANGKDSLLFRVILNDNSDLHLSNVFIETTKGSWIGAEGKTISGSPSIKIFDDQVRRVFEASLRADNNAGTSILRIKVGDISKDTTAVFNTNPPTGISITPTSLTMTNSVNSELAVSISLKSTNGTVSSNYPFTVVATDSLDNEIGTFRIKNEKCQSNICISNFSMVPDTTYVGIIRLKASTIAETSTIEDTSIIYITN